VDASLSLLGTSEGFLEVKNTFTLTATLEELIGGSTAPAVGEIVNVTLIPDSAVTLTDVVDNCATPGTDENGECTVTFTSTTAGTITATASATINVEGLEITTSNGPVTAQFVNGKVEIMPETVNTEVGSTTLFTIYVEENTGSGFGPVSGFIPDYSLPQGLTQVGGTCESGTPVSGGSCTLELANDGTLGDFTIRFDASITITDDNGGSVTIARFDTATVTYVSAFLSVIPDGEINGIGEPHEFTVTVKENTGNGLVGVEGVEPIITFIGDPAQIIGNCITDATGVCKFSIKSDIAGTYTVNVLVNYQFGTLTLTKDETVTKVYKDGSLSWTKVDDVGQSLGGATFQICRTLDRFGNALVEGPECETVADKQSENDPIETADVDPNPGGFKVQNKALGTWTVQETIAPLGYQGDFSRVSEVVLTLDNLDPTIIEPWVNSVAGRIVETGTVCEQYLDGTAIDLTEVIYNINKKDNVINNVAPGVFFYYSTFYAPSADFVVNVDQISDPRVPDFEVQNESNVRLFNGDCSIPNATFTIDYVEGNLGQLAISITGATPGQAYIISVKYESGSVVGVDVPLDGSPPKPASVEYDYQTRIGGAVVDRDIDGVTLRPK
jgi:hypothetical protein